MTLTSILDLASGECRWVGRHDLHVYCHAPLVHGPEAARYCVVCPAAGLAHGTWVTAREAAIVCDRILAGLEPAAAA